MPSKIILSYRRSDSDVITQQMRATIEALPYEVPKLSAVGVGYFTHDTFAERLDRAIDQSNRVLVEGHAR